MKKTYIVIPAYNEESRLPQVIQKIQKYLPLQQVIVVDDGSARPISDFLPKKIHILRHKVNLGKGLALKTGVEFALKKQTKNILFMDADGQHDPKEIPIFIKLIHNNDVVFGSRYIGRGMPLWRLVGNRVLNKSVTLLFGLKLNDIWCGYRCFKSRIYPTIAWGADNYSVDVEMAIKVSKHKLKYQEHFVGTIYHTKESVTATSIVDGIKLLLELFIWKFTL